MICTSDCHLALLQVSKKLIDVMDNRHLELIESQHFREAKLNPAVFSVFVPHC